MWTISCRNKQLFINIFYFSSLSLPLSLSLFRWLPLIYFHSFVRDWRQVDGVKGAFRRLSAGATRPLVGPLISPLPPPSFFFLSWCASTCHSNTFCWFCQYFQSRSASAAAPFLFLFPPLSFRSRAAETEGPFGKLDRYFSYPNNNIYLK